MVKTLTTVSVDSEIRDKAKQILHTLGMSISFYFEQMLRKLIMETECKKEVEG